MKIEFRRTGGFASPASDLNHVDESALTPDEKVHLSNLVAAAAQAPAAPSTSPQRSGAPDSMSYHVAVDSGAHRVSFQGTMAQLPESARALAHWLESHAQRAPKSQ